MDANNKTHSNYRIFKINMLKQLIYNKSDSKLLCQLKKIDLINKLIDNDETCSNSEAVEEIEIKNKNEIEV